MATDKAITTMERSAPPFILSADPARAMKEMMDAIDALRTVYLEENAALEQADTSRFLALQDRKITVARNYQSGASQMIDRREELRAKIGPDIRRQLQAKQEEFSVVSRLNMESLERMKNCTRRLGDRLMTAARDTARLDSHRYGNRGRMEMNERRVSIGLNESA